MAGREHPSDDELVARIARGDRDAFAVLYRQRRPDVYRFALHMSGSAATAEDVVQDVFIAVIHEAVRYTPGRSGVVPWLLGIARNHVKRALHRQRRTVSMADETVWPLRQAQGRPLRQAQGRLPAALSVDADPAAGIAQQQEIAAVRRALGELPVKYREAIVLCDLRELSYADAAAVLKCALGTVRSRLHRGRARLAHLLREREGSVLQSPAARVIL